MREYTPHRRADGMSVRRPARVQSRAPLPVYLRDHHAVLTAGHALLSRSARSQTDPTVGAELVLLAGQDADDLAAMRGVLSDLGIAPSRVKDRVGRWGERIGRLKRNGTVLRRSPLSDVVELEALTALAQVKLHAWALLGHLAEHEARLDVVMVEDRVGRARSQLRRLEALWDEQSRAVLGTARRGTAHLVQSRP